MNEQVGVGDKVMLVWGCCAQHRAHIGLVATVAAIFTSVEGRCASCNRLDSSSAFAHLEGMPPYCGFPLSWLKKMPTDRLVIRKTEEVGA